MTPRVVVVWHLALVVLNMLLNVKDRWLETLLEMSWPGIFVAEILLMTLSTLSWCDLETWSVSLAWEMDCDPGVKRIAVNLGQPMKVKAELRCRESSGLYLGTHWQWTHEEPMWSEYNDYDSHSLGILLQLGNFTMKTGGLGTCLLGADTIFATLMLLL